MSAPSLLKFSLTAKVHEMRAYIMQAFAPSQLEAVVGDELERAMASVPQHVNEAVNTAVRDICHEQVKHAVSGLRWNEEVNDAIKVAVLRELGKAMIADADMAEARIAKRKSALASALGVTEDK